MCTQSTKYTFTEHFLKAENNLKGSHPLSVRHKSPLCELTDVLTLMSSKEMIAKNPSPCSFKGECFFFFVFDCVFSIVMLLLPIPLHNNPVVSLFSLGACQSAKMGQSASLLGTQHYGLNWGVKSPNGT